MANLDQLLNYFESARSYANNRIGAEIETFFVTGSGTAISIEQSQMMLKRLVASGWIVDANKGAFITEVRKGSSRVSYELGYPNLELSVCPYERKRLIARTKLLLEELYEAGETCGAFPLFTPMYGIEGNFLALPDERDKTWLSLDGKEALSPLARISAVQFTVDVEASVGAICSLNRLLSQREAFLQIYPQDAIWRKYIADSAAGYREDRYGGPSRFDSLEDYCRQLSEHAVVCGNKLVPFEQANLSSNASISLFIRSVWWYFRLRRYGYNLCIEVRPIPRRRAECLETQLDQVLNIMG